MNISEAEDDLPFNLWLLLLGLGLIKYLALFIVAKQPSVAVNKKCWVTLDILKLQWSPLIGLHIFFLPSYSCSFNLPSQDLFPYLIEKEILLEILFTILAKVS